MTNHLRGDRPIKMKWEKSGDKGYTHASQEGFYNTQKWRKTRNYIIANEPLCRECLSQGMVRPATVVDHIVPVDDSPELAYEFTNLQPLCDRCHRVKTNRDRGKCSATNLKKGQDLMRELEE